MISFERTYDLDLARAIITHPKVWDKVSDDGCPDPDKFTPVDHPSVWYILVKRDGEPAGLWVLNPQGIACAEVHTCLLPELHGPEAMEAVRAVIPWVWEHTQFVRIFTNVPRYNRLAYRFALRAGMEEFGINERSYMKHGVLYDQIMLGISKPGVI